MSRSVNIIRSIVVLMAVFMLSVDVVAQDSFFREPVARRDTASPRRPRVGVVLCGGGAKGFAHIRILKKIEEAGIPIDYIGGTSIGSIIGGLYAVGYDPDMMEKLVVNQDWNTIIYDKIPRSIKPIEQKMEQTNYIVTLPITKGKVKVSESLVDGVYVNLLLSRLMLPSKGIDDFTQLPVPFFCIGTDVEGSCEYEMSKGCLSRAIRASMAIPVFFTPVKYDGRLLIDGGMVNNFPVRNMQEKGVDIIIGIDLEDYNISAEKIDNSLALFTNMMNLSSHEQTEYGRHNCDIYIRPDLHGLNMMSFSSYDSILSYGEKAAIDIFPKLKRLGDSIRAIEEFTVERPHVKPIDSLYVVDIEVRGLKDNNDPYLKREFGKVFPRLMSVDEIEAAVLRLKDSGFYRDLWYEVEDAAGGVIFILHCKETSNQSLSFDIHYDNNYGIGTLVNYKLMSKGNMFKRGSLSIDLNVAERPYVRVRVNKRDGRFFRYGTEFFANYLIIDQYDNNKLTNSYSTQNDRLEFFGQFTTSHVQSFKFGVAGEFFHMRDQIGDVTLGKDYEFYTYFYTRYYLNTEDLTAFARRGWLVDILAKFILYEGVYTAGDKQPAVSLQADVLKTLPLARRHSLKLGGQLGAKLSKSKLPIPYQYFIGGQSRMKYFDNMIPFYGMSFIDDVVNFITFGKIAWQWNFYRELYSIVSCNAGHMNRDYKDWFNTNSFVAGVGLTLGINTFAGPIEVTLSGSNLKNNLVGFVNVGYWF